MDADAIYPLYRQYVTQLHAALATLSTGPVSEKFRVKRLTLPEFRVVWKSWGREEGVQERWSARFNAGYDADSKSIRQRLFVALGGSAAEAKAA
ncbi:MAG: hypothetical protein IID44_26005 [Planctomycetes bacterium]|nr:hypothetical protein [Planctomycetota bacterium]